MKKITLSTVFLVVAVLGIAASGFGQNPTASRGEQLLAIDQGECMKRARSALLAEGYTFLTAGTYSSIFGGKSIHTAGILCNPAPENKMWVNIVVASVSTDMNLPGAERVKLQGRMEASAGGAAIDWGAQVNGIGGRQIGSRYTFTCKGGGSLSERLWGTDLYTDDSSICTAAVHAGLITTESGGTFTIEVRPSSPSYVGSTRYGVTSKGYGSWGGSFVFVR